MRTRFLSALELAEYLSKNFQAFENERKAGSIPAPDTVFNGMPYWSKATAQSVLAEQENAERNAFGYPDALTAELYPGDEYGN